MLRMLVWTCFAFTLVAENLALARTIGLVRQAGAAFEEVDKTISDIVGEDYSLERMVIDKTTDYASFLKFVKDKKPDLLILMDNAPVRFGKMLSKEKSKKLANLPSVSAMGLNLKEVIIIDNRFDDGMHIIRLVRIVWNQ